MTDLPACCPCGNSSAQAMPHKYSGRLLFSHNCSPHSYSVLQAHARASVTIASCPVHLVQKAGICILSELRDYNDDHSTPVLQHAFSCTRGSCAWQHMCQASTKLFTILSCKMYMAGGPTADSVLEDRSKSSFVLVSPWPLMSKATTRYLHH